MKYCVTNGGGEPHFNTSYDDLFPEFVTGSGERECQLLFCSNHAGMDLALVVQ